MKARSKAEIQAERHKKKKKKRKEKLAELHREKVFILIYGSTRQTLVTDL